MGEKLVTLAGELSCHYNCNYGIKNFHSFSHRLFLNVVGLSSQKWTRSTIFNF